MAIKRVYVSKNKKEAEEMKNEVEFLKELKHPNIVKYYGSEIEGDYLKIYLEYIDMGSISQMLKKYGPFPEEVVVRYTKQILKGLEYLHYHGVMHRDIKGANILVNNNGLVKLGDFGSAKRLQKNVVSSFIGTTCWMAPEIILDKGYERYADIWSLGCTVFEMLTGLPPFVGKSHYEISVKVINHCEGNFKFPKNIGKYARDFILSCLMKVPYERKNVKKLLKHPFIKRTDLNFAQDLFEEKSVLKFEKRQGDQIHFKKSKKEDSTHFNSEQQSQNSHSYNGKVKEIYNKLKKKQLNQQ